MSKQWREVAESSCPLESKGEVVEVADSGRGGDDRDAGVSAVWEAPLVGASLFGSFLGEPAWKGGEV